VDARRVGVAHFSLLTIDGTGIEADKAEEQGNGNDAAIRSVVHRLVALLRPVYELVSRRAHEGAGDEPGVSQSGGAAGFSLHDRVPIRGGRDDADKEERRGRGRGRRRENNDGSRWQRR